MGEELVPLIFVVLGMRHAPPLVFTRVAQDIVLPLIGNDHSRNQVQVIRKRKWDNRLDVKDCLGAVCRTITAVTVKLERNGISKSVTGKIDTDYCYYAYSPY